MMKPVRSVSPFLGCAVLLAFGSVLSAQTTVLRFDPTETSVEFTLGTLLHTVHGTFKLTLLLRVNDTVEIAIRTVVRPAKSSGAP